MNTLSKCLSVCLIAMLTAAVTAAPPQTLSLGNLAHRPDLWPETVTLQKSYRFSGGQSATKGQAVKVVDFDGSQVAVDAGHDLVFQISPADCDLLEGANKAWAKLTPAQQAVDPQSLIKDASLWPDQVVCSGGFTLANGATIQPGGTFDLVSVTPEGVSLWSPQHHAGLIADVSQTDVVSRARKVALIDPAKRPSRLIKALKGTLVDADGKPVPDANIEGTQVFALYYGASWCPPCRHFSPKFVKYINSVAAANPHLTIILMSNDKDVSAMYGYMKEEHMPFPAMTLATLNTQPIFLNYLHGAIPQLAIVDRYGKLISDCYNGTTYVSPDKPMQALDRTLKTGVAK